MCNIFWYYFQRSLVCKEKKKYTPLSCLPAAVLPESADAKINTNILGGWKSEKEDWFDLKKRMICLQTFSYAVFDKDIECRKMIRYHTGDYSQSVWQQKMTYIYYFFHDVVSQFFFSYMSRCCLSFFFLQQSNDCPNYLRPTHTSACRWCSSMQLSWKQITVLDESGLSSLLKTHTVRESKCHLLFSCCISSSSAFWVTTDETLKLEKMDSSQNSRPFYLCKTLRLFICSFTDIQYVFFLDFFLAWV